MEEAQNHTTQSRDLAVNQILNLAVSSEILLKKIASYGLIMVVGSYRCRAGLT